MDNSKIAILSTVINSQLYLKSSQLFPQNIQKYVIDGTNGMFGLDSIFYMMEKLKSKGIEWLIMADEDVLFKNPNVVFDIIEKMKSGNYTVSGIRDGGLISHRNYNPYLINTFFSIINFKEIELIWNKKEVLKNNYIVENEFNDDLKNMKGLFDIKSMYEPYYCFYLWLRRNGKKFLFLNTNQPFKEDEISNAVYFEDRVFLYHTWYARSYGINDKHTIRINNIVEKLEFEDRKSSNAIIFRDKTFYFRQKINKFSKKIQMKIKNILKQK